MPFTPMIDAALFLVDNLDDKTPSQPFLRDIDRKLRALGSFHEDKSPDIKYIADAKTGIPLYNPHIPEGIYHLKENCNSQDERKAITNDLKNFCQKYQSIANVDWFRKVLYNYMRAYLCCCGDSSTSIQNLSDILGVLWTVRLFNQFIGVDQAHLTPYLNVETARKHMSRIAHNLLPEYDKVTATPKP